MSSAPAVPKQFSHLTDLASDLTGTFVLYSTDDYFAEKENLLKPSAPVWIEGKYTDKGKWMDGWESQRKREPGHDFAIVRLGTPGSVHGILADTTHFKGNAPQEVSVEGIEAADTATPGDLIDNPGWKEILPRTAVLPDHPNVLVLPAISSRVTHVRFHIYPDGGVARLRVYGEVKPDPYTFWQRGSVDLAAIEQGGTVAAVSDQFFGPPSNLLLPGRGVNMGDGWETKRRRTPGSDWCVLKLARAGQIDRIELDTHFFKGNAPQATLIEALNEADISADELANCLAAKAPWPVLVHKTPLVQHRKHVIYPDRPTAVTHLRVHIFPHGGVNRMRVFGTAVDTENEARTRQGLNGMSTDEARALFLSWNGSTAFAKALLERRPFATVRSIFQAAEEVWWSLGESDHQEAFAAHPRLGQPKKASTQTEQSASWSAGEQSGITTTQEQVAARLALLNELYVEKFGFIFILFATGRTAANVLEQLERRIENDRAAEVENAAREQAKITRLRIGKWLLGK